jgi:hypothetical protein
MQRIISGCITSIQLVVIWALAPLTVVAANDLVSLDKLIKEKQYQQAYEQASQMLDEHEGEANFDFLYAMAAIESGHPHRAIFSLERLVYEFPDNGRIKVELARAHFLAGDEKTSETIFEEVLQTEPPENVKQKIRIFLRLIDERRIARRSKFTGSVKLTAGWDNNYNSAPDLNIVQIGGISFTLNENSRQQDTNYAGLEANLGYSQYINKKTVINYGVYYQQRDNIGNELDTQTLGTFVSPLFATKLGDFRLPFQYQTLNLDSESYRNYGSIGIEWTPAKQQNSHWTHFIQYGMIRYPDQPSRDMNLGMLGTSLLYISNAGNIYQGALYYSDESSQIDSGEYNEVDTLGMRAFMQWPINPTHSIYSKITLQSMEYGKIHPVFSVLRKDDFYAAALGWEAKLTPVTVFKAEAEYSQNSSNIEIYEYDRTTAFISLRYNFL